MNELVTAQAMANSDEPSPPTGRAPESDELKLIEEFKRTPIRAGCFGCMLSGWSLVLGVAGLVLLVYLIWGLVASR